MHSVVVGTSIGGEAPTSNFAVNGRLALAANQCSDVILDVGSPFEM